MPLISRQKKSVFVHIQKTGGKTIERLLRRYIPDAQPVGCAAHIAWRAIVGRMEHFVDDVATLGQRIGVNFDKVPHENRSIHAHYVDYYTPETEAIVRDVFGEDLERFGYGFNALDASLSSSTQP